MPAHLLVIHEYQSNHSVHHFGLVHGFTGDAWFTWFGWSHVFLVFPALMVPVVMGCIVKVLSGFAR